MVRCDLFIAAAVKAQGFTEREVQIQAEAFFFIVAVESGDEISLPSLFIGVGLPEGHGRITGVSGNGLVIAGEKEGFHVSDLLFLQI
jgi:hypothetical protein